MPASAQICKYFGLTRGHSPPRLPAHPRDRHLQDLPEPVASEQAELAVLRAARLGLAEPLEQPRVDASRNGVGAVAFACRAGTAGRRG